jgi:hypothetical protein
MKNKKKKSQRIRKNYQKNNPGFPALFMDIISIKKL